MSEDTDTPTVAVNVADEIAGWYVTYPDAYETARAIWLEFIHDPDADTDVYVETLNRHVETLRGDDYPGLPEGDIPEVVGAAFAGAMADTNLDQRRDRLTDSIGEIKLALRKSLGET